MSEAEPFRSGELTHQQTDVPAVGLVATSENSDDVAIAVLRAQRAGHQCVVTAHRPDVDGLAYADQAGAVVIPPEELDGDVEASMAQAVRDAGFPGLLYHPDPTAQIDFDTSVAQLAASTEYTATAEIEPRVDRSPDVLAAIPAYNEADSIAAVVTDARKHADDVLVVDDGSTDDTVSRARGAGATVLVHDENTGYGGALKTAFTEAYRAEADHLVILDGDGQHDAGDIPRLVERQVDGDADVVIGSRFGEEAETALPFYRNIGLRVVNLMTNLSLGLVRPRSRISDTQSGFRAYNRVAIESLVDDADIGDHMGASTDILYHANRQDYEIEEVGTTITYDVDNANSQSPVSHGLQLIQNILRTVERDRPVSVLGVPGFVSAVLGIGVGYLTLSNFINTGTFPLGHAMGSVFFTLAGIFACFTAIILHSLEMHDY